MASTTYSIRLDGVKQAIGPFPFTVRSVTLVNRCNAGNLIVVDDRGAQYEATPLTSETAKASDTTYLTCSIDSAQTIGALSVIVTDEDPPTPLASEQLSTISGSGSGSNVQRVTALPATPFDGQVVSFIVDPPQTTWPGVEWLLIFNSATGFWDFIGGSPLQLVDTSGTARANSADSTWQNTPGLAAINVPLAGDYVVEFGADEFVASQVGDVVVCAFGVGGVVNNGGQPQLGFANQTAAVVTVPGGTFPCPVTLVLAAVVTHMMLSAPHGDVHLNGPTLSLRPKRVH